MNDNWVENLIEKHGLPSTFYETIDAIYVPISKHLNSTFSKTGTPKVIGINGCQGSGKSTMAEFLAGTLKHEHDRETLILSLDDFYLSKSKRVELSNNIHPLLKTRGVPGTHDIDFLCDMIAIISAPGKIGDIVIPQFDKGSDDLRPQSAWKAVDEKPEFILLEGWCIGASSQSEKQLNDPINSLEAINDENGMWRRFVNRQLKESYADLFAMIESLIVISPPSTDVVFQWRREQEQKLRGGQRATKQIGQTDKELQRFIMHYQRLTEHMHKTLPESADIVVNLNVDRSLVNIQIRD